MLLEEVIDQIQSLSKEEQDHLARLILEEIEESETLNKSSQQPGTLTDEAFKDFNSEKTAEL
jgi:hypothetical protein